MHKFPYWKKNRMGVATKSSRAFFRFVFESNFLWKQNIGVTKVQKKKKNRHYDPFSRQHIILAQIYIYISPAMLYIKSIRDPWRNAFPAWYHVHYFYTVTVYFIIRTRGHHSSLYIIIIYKITWQYECNFTFKLYKQLKESSYNIIINYTSISYRYV